MVLWDRGLGFRRRSALTTAGDPPESSSGFPGRARHQTSPRCSFEPHRSWTRPFLDPIPRGVGRGFGFSDRETCPWPVLPVGGGFANPRALSVARPVPLVVVRAPAGFFQFAVTKTYSPSTLTS